MRNVEFMLNNGLALYATKSFPLDEAVFTLFYNPERINNLRSSIDAYKTKFCTKLYNFLTSDLQIEQ